MLHRYVQTGSLLESDVQCTALTPKDVQAEERWGKRLVDTRSHYLVKNHPPHMIAAANPSHLSFIHCTDTIAESGSTGLK